MTWSISLADNYINSRLSGGPYTVPFASTPVMLTDLSARLAGYYLYSSRGVSDPDDQVKNQVVMHKDYVEEMIARIHCGKLKLIDATATATVTYPVVVESDDEES